jgi:hypothetical protein
MRIITVIASVILFFHGLIHLIGAAAYLKLAEIEQLPYKTTVLGGRWDLGSSGTAIFGILWAVAAIGFILAAIALFGNWDWWRSVLIGVTLFSLVLTSFDWGVAYAGVVVNLAILLILLLGPWISNLIAP